MGKPNYIEGWHLDKPIDFDAFHEKAVEWATNKFHNKGNEVLAGYFIFGSPTIGSAAVFHIPWTDDNDKQRTAFALRGMLENPDIAIYSFISEAWAVIATPDDPFDEDIPRPSQHPDREDILQIWTSSRASQHKMTRFGVKLYKPKLTIKPKGLVLEAKPPRLLERDDQFMDRTHEILGTMFNFFIPYEENERLMEEAKAQWKEKTRGKSE